MSVSFFIFVMRYARAGRSPKKFSEFFLLNLHIYVDLMQRLVQFELVAGVAPQPGFSADQSYKITST